jgi:hypothetical protein
VRPLTGVEEAAVIDELAEVADGRIEVAGLAIGFHEQGTECASVRASHRAVHQGGC